MSSKRPPFEPWYHSALEQLKEASVQMPTAAPEPEAPQDQGKLGAQVEEERVRRERIENDNKEKDQSLKEMTLKRLFVFLGGETVVVFGVAFMQGFHLWGFNLDEWSLRLLLAATIVQTVSMLTIAIKHLFPQKDQ